MFDTNPKQPWSVVTAASYPLASIWPMVEHPGSLTAIFFVAMFLLMLGTAAHHWTGLSDPRGSDLDHVGMNAVYLMLATIAITTTPVWAVLAIVAAVVIEYVAKLNNHSLMGGCAFLSLVGGFAAGNAAMALGGFVLMGTGYLYQSGSDKEHGIGWHNLTAIGTAVMLMALLG